MRRSAKSPLETPSSSKHHSRRPSNPRRSSSDKKTSKPSSSTADKHATAKPSLTSPIMSTSPSALKAPLRGEEPAAGETREKVTRSSRDNTQETSEESSTTDDDGDIESAGNRPSAGRPTGKTPNHDTSASAMADLVTLREQVALQMRLTEQRAKAQAQQKDAMQRQNSGLAGTSGRPRVSPIVEEPGVSGDSPSIVAGAFASPPTSGLPTASTSTESTESAKTIRGGETPGWTPLHNTPGGYPFPPMRTPSNLSYTGHRPFTALSPTVAPEQHPHSSFTTPRERLTSAESGTPGSFSFFPSGTEPLSNRDDPDFPIPNIYDLSLLLTAEPGLDPWWSQVVAIMRDVFQAERVTLAVPADATDIENVPWGQKATFNAFEEDELSLTYLPLSSSVAASSGGTLGSTASESTGGEELSNVNLTPGLSKRPTLTSRHSYTSYEDTKRGSLNIPDSRLRTAQTPGPMSRSKSYFGVQQPVTPKSPAALRVPLNEQSLEDHLAHEKTHNSSGSWEDHQAAARQVHGRVFPVLQALDYEADPLLDNAGVSRVLKRDGVVALTRDFPYLDKDGPSIAGSNGPDRGADKGSKQRPSATARSSSHFSGSTSSRRSSRASKGQASDRSKKSSGVPGGEEIEQTEQTRLYEEYEQAPPSPWTQSPAPSPAVRADPSENPFFTDSQIDEDTFNPTHTPQDYSSMQQLEAIGFDKSCTVLHIPLYHVLLSKPVKSFRLDAAVLKSRYGGKDKTGTDKGKVAETLMPTTPEPGKRSPIAILSILSPLVPYPLNLRRSLSYLAPHLATSFSLCRHYSNLENQIAGLSRKRPQTTGFGAVAPTPHRPAADRVLITGMPSTRSPGDDDHRNSITDSIASPSDSSNVSRSVIGSPGGTPLWGPSNVSLSLGNRSSGGSPAGAGVEGYFGPKSRPQMSRVDTSNASLATRQSSQENSPAQTRHNLKSDYHDGTGNDRPENVDVGKQVRIDTRHHGERGEEANENVSTSRRASVKQIPGTSPMASPRDRPHTQLHSYGADFNATFQSLANTTVSTRGHSSSPPSRLATLTEHIEMPPPSDRLKQLMLDTLPAHLFVAMPQTGEIVWVNNRYLTYRGQTVSDLYNDPWASIHPEERDDYLKAWSHAVRSGEQFSMQVRIRRFDGNYRWFYTRAVGGRDTRGVIVQWYGSYMDIHDQHIAEVKAARQAEIEASEAKHRLLANLIPQIIFAATEDEGITFANEQWLSYTGQKFEDALGLGFIDFVHQDDLAKCRIPSNTPPTPSGKHSGRGHERTTSGTRAASKSSGKSESKSEKSSNTSANSENTVKGMHQALSRTNSSSSESVYELPSANLSELAKSGAIKVTTDSNGRLSYTTEVRLKSKSGEYRWHLVRCVEVDNINFGSGASSWFGACTDINDHKLLETKLKEAMESKTRFLSNMSHEIRTPLIGISGMVSFLQDTILNEEQLDYTNTIQTSANSLLMIINDILDLSKVDAGMMKLSYEWFHTSSLIEDVNELVSTMAISKRLELNYVVEEDVPPMVKGDRVRIRQVLLNVIGNAIKFTQEGEVFSTCRVYHDKDAELGKDEIMLEYSILDTGRGFTKEEAELIFKPFSQIDGSSTRQHGGSGLGLVISRQLVELHGGHMDGTAVPGKGSTFNFTAKFGLPTEDDHPEPPMTPAISKNEQESTARSQAAAEVSARALKSAGYSHPHPMLTHRFLQSPPTLSPATEPSVDSPSATSAASSAQSVGSSRTQNTQRSSVSSASTSLRQFQQATRSGSQDMKLSLPERTLSMESGKETDRGPPSTSLPLPEHSRLFRPPLYSILIVCPQAHSRQATKKHIEMTLPKDIPHQITPLASYDDARALITGDDPVIFTHIVLNLPIAEEIISMMELILQSPPMSMTSIVILSDPVQRQGVMRLAPNYEYEELAKAARVTFIYKPVKPSRFAVIFDPDKERDMSTDRNRSTAQQLVATQKQNYLDAEKRLGNRGFRLLLVEDNMTNQKVLLKFLSKVGIAVDTAEDGMECTDKVFSHPHGYYSLILCDLHMPRKDGYETCKDIRKWEKKEKHPHMPIIALSANVMVDVLDKCVSAGFDSYVTKPVDFKELSIAIADLLDPSGKTGSSTDSLGNSPTPSASALAFAKVSRKSGDKKQKEDAK